MDDSPDPNRQEQIARMEAIMLRLPRLTREIFLAHRLDDMPYDEIARRTGLTVRQVERHIARAILALMRGLDGESRPWWKFW
ncbi:MAG TPA: sigma-70 region 4 domain-containing protein [Propylenella sp.]|nr:sigma-70 region 4 domain-containing protein [Propylenella sp.]